MNPLAIYRDIDNKSYQIIKEWAETTGLEGKIPRCMHATVMSNTKPVDTTLVELDTTPITAKLSLDAKTIKIFGEASHVIVFESEELTAREKDIHTLFDLTRTFDYVPHISFMYCETTQPSPPPPNITLDITLGHEQIGNVFIPE